MNLEAIDAHLWSKSIMADYEGYFTAYPQCHPGWDRVLRGFFDIVRSQVPDATNFRLHQVKEKFGELRIYYALDGVTEEVSAAVRQAATDASALSLVTCELSGEPGALINRDGYIAVRCERLRKPGDIALPAEYEDIPPPAPSEGADDTETETVVIVDYLLEREPPCFILRPKGDDDRLEREVAYCALVALGFDADRSLAPQDIGALLVSHYGYGGGEPISVGSELDVSMVMQRYDVWGTGSAVRDGLVSDQSLHREHLAQDIITRLALRPID